MSKDRELLREALQCISAKDYPSLWRRIDDRLAEPQGDAGRQVNHDEVICPKCVHQFRAIPQNVQEELAALRAEGTPAWAVKWPNGKVLILSLLSETDAWLQLYDLSFERPKHKLEADGYTCVPGFFVEKK